MELSTLIGVLTTLQKGELDIFSYCLMIGVTGLCIYHVYQQMNSSKKQSATIQEMLTVTEATKDQIAKELDQTRQRLDDCQKGQDMLHDKINQLNERLGQYAIELQELRDKK